MHVSTRDGNKDLAALQPETRLVGAVYETLPLPNLDPRQEAKRRGGNRVRRKKKAMKGENKVIVHTHEPQVYMGIER